MRLETVPIELVYYPINSKQLRNNGEGIDYNVREISGVCAHMYTRNTPDIN